MRHETIDLQKAEDVRRLELFGITPELEAAGQRLSELFEPHMRAIAESYYDVFFANFDREVTPEMRNEHVSRTAEYSRTKYHPPFDASWVAKIRRVGQMQYRLGCKSFVYMGSHSRSMRKSLQLVLDGAHDEAEARYLADALMQISTLEAEIMMSTYQQEREKFHREKADKQAQQFQGEISGSVARAADKSRQSREQCEAAVELTNALLAMASEVAASSQQSASAMGEAAETSGGIKDSIDTIRHDLAETVSSLHDAAEIANRAVEDSDLLADHSQSIQKILSMIKAIAEQTNILALNASIEAARAGDAGRGFAVVASEIKELAGKTARATDEVGDRLGGIREVAKTATSTNRQMLGTFDTIRASADRLNAIMEEQSSNVTRIAACVDETATSAESSTEVLADISSMVETIAGDLGKVAAKAIELDADMADLTRHADGFVHTLTQQNA